MSITFSKEHYLYQQDLLRALAPTNLADATEVSRLIKATKPLFDQEGNRTEVSEPDWKDHTGALKKIQEQLIPLHLSSGRINFDTFSTHVEPYQQWLAEVVGPPKTEELKGSV